jgi:excisionase family DNA binding protein
MREKTVTAHVENHAENYDALYTDGIYKGPATLTPGPGLMYLKKADYTPLEVATICRVSRRTVYNWIKDGRLYARKVGPLKRLISDAHLQAFLRVCNEPAAQEQPENKQLSAKPKPVKKGRRG